MEERKLITNKASAEYYKAQFQYAIEKLKIRKYPFVELETPVITESDYRDRMYFCVELERESLINFLESEINRCNEIIDRGKDNE